MLILEQLSFGLRPSIPMFFQNEEMECGLACLGMIANYHGLEASLDLLRQRFRGSYDSASISSVIHIAGQLDLATRPVTLDLEDTKSLKLPCILNWDNGNFVVLKEIGRKTITIHDPAFGVKKISWRTAAASFGGFALEIWPNEIFRPYKKREKISLVGLVGRIRGFTGAFIQIGILALALELFALISPFFLQWVIDNVILSSDKELLATLAIGFGLLMFTEQIVGTIRSWMILHMSTTLSIQWRTNVFMHLLRLPMQYFEKRHLGDVVSRFGSIDQIQKTLTTSFIESILDGLMTVITLVMMFVYSALLGSIVTAFIVFYALLRWIWYRPLHTAMAAQIVHSAKQQTHFFETVQGVKAIKLFSRQDERRGGWLRFVVSQANADLRTQKIQLYYKLANGLFDGIENILVIWLGAKLVMDGHFTVGALMAFTSYKNQFGDRVGSLINRFFDLKSLELHSERLADIVHTAPERSTGQELASNGNDIQASITASALCFRYSDDTPFVLHDVDFEILQGESVAIVGASGCGKSTLINIILGILPATEGAVLIGGININDVGVDRLRQMIGTVMQDDVLFAGSIGENISFFDTHPDKEWIAACAETAAISSEIQAMPRGYDTHIGDMGTVLSGGQKQRILLARALYKRPKILLLDEATSHLDVLGEKKVNAAINTLNVTRVIVAHRPETIASAGRIIDLSRSRSREKPSARINQHLLRESAVEA